MNEFTVGALITLGIVGLSVIGAWYARGFEVAMLRDRVSILTKQLSLTRLQLTHLKQAAKEYSGELQDQVVLLADSDVDAANLHSKLLQSPASADARSPSDEPFTDSSTRASSLDLLGDDSNTA